MRWDQDCTHLEHGVYVVGAPEKLGNIIEGESLLNDGMAYVRQDPHTHTARRINKVAVDPVALVYPSPPSPTRSSSSTP